MIMKIKVSHIKCERRTFMKEKHFYPRQTLRLFMIIGLLLLPLLSMIPGKQAQAADQQAGIDNPTYTLTTTSNGKVSTKANPNETTVLIFGHTGCSYTRSTLNSLTSCDWIKRSDIRVIFADCNLHTQEEVLAYEQGYQCPDITFCYHDEDDLILRIMYEYKQRSGLTSNKLPMIVLIDKNNKIQNVLSYTKTSDELLTEIKKFADLDDEGTTPPPGSDVGFENYAYGLKSIANTVVSTKAEPDKTTLLLFGDVTCNITKGTLTDIYNSSWVTQKDIRVIYADVQGASLDDTKTFAQNFPNKGILFCHDEAALNFNFALSYLKYYNLTSGQFPYIVLIDRNNRVRDLTLSYQSPEDIYQKIEKIAAEPPAPTISNVSGLKTASYAAKNVKLSWKKVPKATGYIIYQYNASKKKWTEKETLKKNTASYTVKGLNPGTDYRFAVKAYIKSQDGKKTTSKSYASIYTATAPNAVSFRVTPGKKKATIKWTKVKGATSYTVFYKTNTQKNWKKLKELSGTSYIKTKLKSGTAYTFTVKANKTYKGKTYTSNFSSKTVKVK